MQPYEYQQDALDRIEAARIGGGDKALLVMATALGKTVTAAFELKRVLEDKPDTRVLVLCHQNEILRQNARTFKDVIGPDLKTGAYFAGWSDANAQVVFASFQSMARGLAEFEPDAFDYVIVDEVHHVEARTFKAVFAHFTPAFALGMTATKDRGDGLRIEDTFGEPVFSLELPEAMRRRLVSTVDYRVITDDLMRSGRVKTAERDVTVSELNSTVFIPVRDEEIAAVIEKQWAKTPNPRTIVFAESTLHAERLAQLLGGVSYHSAMGEGRQLSALASFRSGKAKTIVTVNMFNEGVDIPEANVIVFARVTQSRMIFLQQLGRGLRLHADKAHVTVLDFAANGKRLHMVHEVARGAEGEINPREIEILTDPRVTFTFSEEALQLLDLLDKQSELSTPEGIVDRAVQLFGNRGGQPVQPLDVLRASRSRELPPGPTIVALFANRGERDGLGNFIVEVERRLAIDNAKVPSTQEAVLKAAAVIMAERNLSRPLNRLEVAKAAAQEILPPAAVIEELFADDSGPRKGFENFREALAQYAGLGNEPGLGGQSAS